MNSCVIEFYPLKSIPLIAESSYFHWYHIELSEMFTISMTQDSKEMQGESDIKGNEMWEIKIKGQAQEIKTHEKPDLITWLSLLHTSLYPPT